MAGNCKLATSLQKRKLCTKHREYNELSLLFLERQITLCSLWYNQWCIKSIYNGFAIAIDCILKVVPFGFCFVKVMPLFIISFWLLRHQRYSIFIFSNQLVIIILAGPNRSNQNNELSKQKINLDPK